MLESLAYLLYCCIGLRDFLIDSIGQANYPTHKMSECPLSKNAGDQFSVLRMSCWVSKFLVQRALEDFLAALGVQIQGF